MLLVPFLLSIANVPQEPSASIPSLFIENKGQWPQNVKFAIEEPGTAYWATDRGIVLDVHQTNGQKRVGHVLKFELEGATGTAKGIGNSAATHLTSYFGPDGTRATDVRSFESATVANVRNGFSLRHYRDAAGVLRYDLIVSPNADVTKAVFNVKGATNIGVDAKGELLIGTSLGTVRQRGLFAYQTINGKQTPVAINFAPQAGNKFGFKVGQYDKSKPLVIDPQVVKAAFIGGGSGADLGSSIAKADDNVVFVGGTTNSSLVSFPLTTGGYISTEQSGTEAFVAAIETSLGTNAVRRVARLTTYGNEDSVRVVYSGGSVYLATAVSNNGPIVDDAGAPGAPHKATRQSTDVWIGRFNSALTTLRSSTYAGGPDFDRLLDMVATNNGRITIAMQCAAAGAATKTQNNANSTHKGSGDLYLLALDAALETMITGGYYGGTGYEAETGFMTPTVEGDGVFVAVSASAPNAYPGAQTVSTSPSVVVTPTGYYTDQQRGGNASQGKADIFDFTNDLLLYRITIDTRTGSTSRNGIVTHATFIGGSGSEQPRGIAISPNGILAVIGTSDGGTLAGTSGAYQTANPGGTSGFVFRANSTLNAGIATSFLGTAGADNVNGVAISPNGQVILTGSAVSGLPVTTGSYAAPGTRSAYLARLSGGLTSLVSSTYLLSRPGSEAGDGVKVVQVGAYDDALVLGNTIGTTASFSPITTNTYGVRGGSSDFFLGRVAFSTDIIEARASSTVLNQGSSIFIEALMNAVVGGVGKTITVTSDNPSAISFASSTFVVPASTDRKSVKAFPGSVIVPTNVTVTLSNGGNSRSVVITVNP